MVLPRALIALALCLSAAAATVPTPTIHDETLVSRDYPNGGNDGGNHGGDSGRYNDGNNGGNRGNHGGDSGRYNDGNNGGNRGNSGDNDGGRGSGNSGSNNDRHNSGDNYRGNSGKNDGRHSGDNNGGHNNGGHSSDNNRGHSGGNDGGNTDYNGGRSGGDNGNRKVAAAAPSQRSIPSRRRALNTMTAFEIAVEICPNELYACPIAEAGTLSSLPASLSDWISGGYECIDPQADLRACGGCASLDAKHDCTLIPGANDISCVAGACVVDSCVDSYEFDSDSKTCVPN